MESEGLRELDK